MLVRVWGDGWGVGLGLGGGLGGRGCGVSRSTVVERVIDPAPGACFTILSAHNLDTISVIER